jgi:hypothetical protein
MVKALLLIWSVLVVEPEDTCSPYLMNMVYATPPARWAVFYDSVNAGFLTLQGSLDDEYWYQIYQAKFDIPVYKGFRLRYRYLRLQDYGIAEEIHRIEPTLRITGNLYGHFLYLPSFTKKNNELGLGVSLFENNLNYIEGVFSIKDFENNLSQRAVPSDRSRDLYKQQPFRLSLEARRNFKIGFAKIYGEYVTPSIKEYDYPPASWLGRDNLTYSSSYATEGRFELKPFGFWGLGSTFSYKHSGERSEYTNTIPGGTDIDTLSDLTIEPYSFVPINEKLTFTMLVRFNHKLHSQRKLYWLSPTVLYERFWYSPGILLEFQPNPKTIYSLGYQHSWRNRWSADTALVTNYDTHNRLDLFFEYVISRRGSIVIKEGVDLDNLFYHNLRYFIHDPHDMWYWGMVVRF